MRAGVGVVVVALSACGFPPAPKAPTPVPLVAAPTTFNAKPLKVGQWAVYRERVGNDEIGTVSFAVVGEGACGTWIEAALVGHGSSRRTWRFCVDAEHRVTEAMLNDEPVIVARHDDELPPLLTRVLPPRFVGHFVSDDAFVPAAHFTGALRLDGATTTWLHPDVPLGAVVEVKAGTRDDVLVAYGDAQPPSLERETREPSRALRPSPRFYELEYGFGWWSGVPNGESSTLESFRAIAGGEVAPDFDFVFAGQGESNRRYASSDEMAASATLLSAGVRWHLFGRSRSARGPDLPYLEATAGLSWLTRGQQDGAGVGATAAVGWELLRGAGWGLGYRGEYTELEPLAGQAPRRHAFEAGVMVRLQLP